MVGYFVLGRVLHKRASSCYLCCVLGTILSHTCAQTSKEYIFSVKDRAYKHTL